MRLRNILIFLSIFLLLFIQKVMAVNPGHITPEEGKIMIQQKKDLVILDVRTPEEYAVIHYPEALLIPISELDARFSEVPADKPVLIYCRKGRRAERGYMILREKRPDIKELYYIKGEPIY